jgi:hypothetical protein
MKTSLVKKSVIYPAISFILALVVSGCSVLGGGQSKSASSSTATGQSPPIENFVGSAGIKNVNQLLLSMAAVTNISAASLAPNGANSALTTQYNIIAPFISADGSVASINPAMLLSITGLAGQVCQIFVQGEASTPNVLSGTGVSFGGTVALTGSTNKTTTVTVSNANGLLPGMTITGSGIPSGTTIASILGMAITLSQAATSTSSSVQLTASVPNFSSSGWSGQFTGSSGVTANVVNALSNQFWGRAPTSAELSTLTSAIQSSTSSVPGTGNTGVQNVLIVPCTIMLASPAFLLG